MSFQCWRSGHCCHDVEVSRQEFGEMIMSGPLLGPLQLTIVEPLSPTPLEKRNLVISGRCPFYDEDGRLCSIYEKRPSVCRGYLCFRPDPGHNFRPLPEQSKFMRNNPEAYHQAMSLRKEAMVYAKEHGWYFPDSDDLIEATETS